MSASKLIIGLVLFVALSGKKKKKLPKGHSSVVERVLKWREKVEKVLTSMGLDVKVYLPLVLSTIEHESGGNEKAKGPTNDGGLFQFIPATAQTYGLSKEDRFDADKAIPAGIHLLRDLVIRYKGELKYVFSAYNAGSGTVAKYFPAIHNEKYVKTAEGLYEKWKQILQS